MGNILFLNQGPTLFICLCVRVFVSAPRLLKTKYCITEAGIWCSAMNLIITG